MHERLVLLFLLRQGIKVKRSLGPPQKAMRQSEHMLFLPLPLRSWFVPLKLQIVCLQIIQTVPPATGREMKTTWDDIDLGEDAAYFRIVNIVLAQRSLLHSPACADKKQNSQPIQLHGKCSALSLTTIESGALPSMPAVTWQNEKKIARSAASKKELPNNKTCFDVKKSLRGTRGQYSVIWRGCGAAK